MDWLFFTGKLPAGPVGRLISTASHARQIVFAEELTATRTFERIRAAHAGVERQRGQRIPDWAHRDVLYMLIGRGISIRLMKVWREPERRPSG